MFKQRYYGRDNNSLFTKLFEENIMAIQLID